MIRSNRTVKLTQYIIVKGWIICSGIFSNRRSNKKSKPKKILVIKTCCLGDGIISLYALREYKRLHTGVIIDILCSERIREIYGGFSFINKIYSIPVTGHQLWKEILLPSFWITLIQLIRKLRSNHYDEMVDMELYNGFPIILKPLLAIALSRGFRVEGALNKPHTKLITRGRNTPEWQCFFDLLELPYRNSAISPLYLLPEPKQPEIRNNIGLVIGASFNWPQKKWPLIYFKELLIELSKHHCSFILLGTEDDLNDGKMLEQQVSAHMENTIGKLSFTSLREKLFQCDLIVGNDTGTMHLAAAAGIPCVTLFGPTNHSKWNALTSTPVTANFDCSPCYYLSSMPLCNHVNCLKHLSPKRVLKVVLEILKS